MAKKTKVVEPRDWYAIRDDLEQWARMYCRPTHPKYKWDAIIDENQTVKWNRDEVARRNTIHEQEVKDLNTKKNKLRDTLFDELYAKIVYELQGKVTLAGAAKIYDYAYERGHANGMQEVFIYLMELVELFQECLLKED